MTENETNNISQTVTGSIVDKTFEFLYNAAKTFPLTAPLVNGAEWLTKALGFGDKIDAEIAKVRENVSGAIAPVAERQVSEVARNISNSDIAQNITAQTQGAMETAQGFVAQETPPVAGEPKVNQRGA